MVNTTVPSSPKSFLDKLKASRSLRILFLIIIFLAVGKLILGGTKETQLPIPQPLKDAQIAFNVPMYYQIGSPLKIRPYKSGHNELISTSTKFSIIGAINKAHYGLSAIDTGTRGVDYLILQDQYGQKSYISYMYFNRHFNPNGSFNGRNNGKKVYNASYYKNGQKIGEVDLEISY